MNLESLVHRKARNYSKSDEDMSRGHGARRLNLKQSGETFIYGSKITTTTGFPNSSFMSHTNHFLFVVRTCKISSLSKLQVHNTVLISSGTLIKGSIFTGVNRVKGISKGYLKSWGQPWVGSCYHLQPNEGA